MNNVDPWGLAMIGGRDLEGNIPFNGMGSLRHDNIWYSDGSNSGFFNDDTIRNDGNHTIDEYDFTRDPRYYDDDLMRQAEKNVRQNWDMDWRMPWWNPWDWNNCQDYTDAVREEYERLEKERQEGLQNKKPKECKK